MADNPAVLVLAAGKGTRMKSGLIKVLHPLMGQPMLAHVLNSSKYMEPERVVVVVGHQAEKVEAAFENSGLVFARQEEQLGTGHAVAASADAFKDFDGTILILSGDVPLLSPQTMMDFLEAHRRSGVTLSVLTVQLQHPGAYGRIVRDEAGYLQKIVEARDASPEELSICEINSGIYAVDGKFLFQAVDRLKPENDQKEYYLTDIIADAHDHDLLVAAIMCPDPEEVLGINDRVELAQAVNCLQLRTNHAWLLAGVTMIDPQRTYIETAVKLAPDVTLWPGAVILGQSKIETGVTVGPDCLIKNALIKAGATIGKGAVVDGVEVAENEVIEPLTVMSADKTRKNGE